MQAHELLTAHLSDWAAVCKNAQTLPEAFAQLNNTKLVSLWHGSAESTNLMHWVA